MSLLFNIASRTFRSSVARQQRSLAIVRYQSTQTNNEQQSTTNSSNKTQRRYRSYVISIGIGALLGSIYTLRQSQKYEGLMPEYVSNSDTLDRQALDARPLPPPVTRHVTFEQAARKEFPFKITLYQYVTWFVSRQTMCSLHMFYR
jgi:hypothetical protein